MNIDIIAIGTLKEKYLKDAFLEYQKRITRFANVNLIEIKEGKTPKNASVAEIEQVLKEEGDRIITKMDKGVNICLAIEGKQMNTESLTHKIKDIITYQGDKINFIIGSSHGLSKNVKDKSTLLLSLSDLTFPHQLARIILIEQLYRVIKILNNEPYHK